MSERSASLPFSIGEWRVDPSAHQLVRDEEQIVVEPQMMEVLVYLAHHAGEVISHDELIEKLWHGTIVSDGAIYQNIAKLRQALHDDSHDSRYIETISRGGYRLIAEVRFVEDGEIAVSRDHASLLTQFFQRKPVFAAAGVLFLALVYFAFDELIFESPKQEPVTAASIPIAGIDPSNQQEISIAVLPFVNMSDDPNNEYFSDGISEEIINLLANIPGLKVIGRTSSFSFKGKNEDLRVIGQTLGARTVLEGSVRKSGEQVRITAQLVDVSDGTHIWSESYDREVNDIFAVQSEVAVAIIDALHLHVSTSVDRGRPTENSEAYALFLKARDLLHFLHPTEGPGPIALLTNAIELDPNFAEAHELLAAAYFSQGGVNIAAAEGQMLMGEAAANALAINPNLVFARALYEMGDIENWSFAREIEALETAVRAQPANPDLLNQLAWDLLYTGYIQEALTITQRRLELDPISNAANYRLFDALYASGRTNEAVARLELLVQLGDDFATYLLGVINLLAVRDEAAIQYLEAYNRTFDPPDAAWVREWVINTRDPAAGQAFLDRQIPQVAASWSYPENGEWHRWRGQLRMSEWYLYFGYLDRYFELILATDLSASTWNDAESEIRNGITYRRLGFTAHPKYLEVAKATGVVDVWEQRGPPDYCEKVDGQWVCE